MTWGWLLLVGFNTVVPVGFGDCLHFPVLLLKLESPWASDGKALLELVDCSYCLPLTQGKGYLERWTGQTLFYLRAALQQGIKTCISL